MYYMKGFFNYCFYILLISGLVIDEVLSNSNGYNKLLTEKPIWLKTCKKNDVSLDDCLKDLFLVMFPALAQGIPDLDIEPFEPLHIDRVGISKGTGPVTLTGNLYNLTAAGPSKATPTYTQMDLEKKIFNFGINLPYLDIKSQYNLKGKILVLPLVGHGDAELLLKDVRTNVTTTISFPEVDGREIFKVDSMKVKFIVKSLKVKFENLFNGNKVLGTTVNNFLNKNGLEVIGELSDNISENLAQIFTELMNKVFRNIPTDLWLIDESLEAIAR